MGERTGSAAETACLPPREVLSIMAYTGGQWRIQGRGPGGPGPPLFLDQNEARRGEKHFFEAVPPYLRVWMTAPPLSESLDPPLEAPPSKGTNLVPSALFPGFGGGAGKAPKAREKRPGDEVERVPFSGFKG